MALDGAEHHHVVEIGALQPRADLRGKEGGDCRDRLAAREQPAAQAWQRGAPVEAEALRRHRGTARRVCRDLEPRILGVGDDVGEAVQAARARPLRPRRDDDRGLGGALADQPVRLQLAQGLAQGDQAHPETACQLRLGRQRSADLHHAAPDRIAQMLRSLAIQRAVGAIERTGEGDGGRHAELGSGRFGCYDIMKPAAAG